MVHAPFHWGFPIVAIFLAACSQPAPPAKPQSTPPPAPVRILQFYATPAKPPKGEKTLVCYGVENATELRLDPPIEKVWPALTHCFYLFPVKRVTYTLTAVRGAEQVSQSIVIQPGPPAVRLLQTSISAAEVAKGQRVTVCFTAVNAVSVTIRPGEWIPPHSNGVGCAGDQPEQSTIYTVTATGEGGDVASQKLPVKVK